MFINEAIHYLTKVFSQGTTAYSTSIFCSSTIVGSGLISKAASSFMDRTSFDDFAFVATMEVICLFIYLFFTLLNFATGLQASKHEALKQGKKRGEHIDNSKLWYMIWKFLGVLFVTILVAVFCIFMSAAGLPVLFWSMVLFLGVIWFLCCCWEFHSMGQNFKRRWGVAPPIFMFVDKVSKSVETKTLKKIEETSVPSKDDVVEP